MTVVIDKNTTKAQLDKALSNVSSKKRKTNWHKFAGKVSFAGEDGLAYQKKVRNEWE